MTDKQVMQQLVSLRDMAWREGAVKTVKAIDSLIGTPQERRSQPAFVTQPVQSAIAWRMRAMDGAWMLCSKDSYDSCVENGLDAQQLHELPALAQPVQPAVAMRLADAIDPLVRHAAPDHLTMECAAKMLRALTIAQPVQPVHQNNALIDAIDAVLSNQEHAFSGGMCHYQKGSQTWQVYEDLRIAQYNIAQPVQPAAQWTPTPENINTLPEAVRQYIHALSANCDPAGMVAENTLLKDCNLGLQMMYRKAVDSAVTQPVQPTNMECWYWEHQLISGKVIDSGFSRTKVDPTDNALCGAHPEGKVSTVVQKLTSAPSPQPVQPADTLDRATTPQPLKKLLHQALAALELYWEKVDDEWGPEPGGLEGAILRGEEPVIIALRAAVAQPVQPSSALVMRPLQWSEQRDPFEGIRYNHVVASSAIGLISIEWKSWKEFDPYVVFIDGDYLGVESKLEDAKALAVNHLRALALLLIDDPVCGA